MSRAIKRICSDIKKLHKSNINEHGIYFHYDEEDVFSMKAMMVGPEGTPYYGGAYYFDIKFPKTYPLQPPLVKTMTQGNKTRFNPNLYTSGKVCLSMLNTWSGPGWTPCNSIESVLLSIQAMVLVKDPLKNEPGYETASKTTLNAYSSIIRFENIRISIIKMDQKPPDGFDIFKIDFMQEYIKRYNTILEIVKKYSKEQDGKTINSTYSMSRIINYKPLIPIVEKIYNNSSKVGLVKTNIKSVNTDSESDKANLITAEYINKMSDIGYAIEIDETDTDDEELDVSTDVSTDVSNTSVSTDVSTDVSTSVSNDVSTDNIYEWFNKDLHNISNQANEHLQSINLVKQKILELRAICDIYIIPTKKKSTKTGKMIWKYKKELINDIQYLIHQF